LYLLLKPHRYWFATRRLQVYLDMNSFSRSLEHLFAYSLTQLLSPFKEKNPKTIRKSYNFCLPLLKSLSSHCIISLNNLHWGLNRDFALLVILSGPAFNPTRPKLRPFVSLALTFPSRNYSNPFSLYRGWSNIVQSSSRTAVRVPGSWITMAE